MNIDYLPTDHNTQPPSPLTVDELDTFVAGREKYRETSDPIRTLQVAFMDEAGEVMVALPKKEGATYDHENLSEEIGDMVIMSVLIARNQHVPLSEILPSRTITEFQSTNPQTPTPYNWMQFGTSVIDVYATIDQREINPNTPDTTQALQKLMNELATIATAHDIDLNLALHQTIDKLSNRTRENHAVRDDKKLDAPKTHAGKYLLKTGAIALKDILAAEQENRS